MPELMKLLRTKSMIRYLPPKGTAGLARSLVSGWRRVPFPPASTIPSTRSCISLRPIFSIRAVVRKEKKGVLGHWTTHRGPEPRCDMLRPDAKRDPIHSANNRDNGGAVVDRRPAKRGRDHRLC